MRKVVAVVAAAVGLAWAGPASADQSQAGCQVFGETVAATVQANVPAGAIASGIAQGGPGAVASFVSGAKQTFCSP
jgi:hypothetical protein